MASLGGKARFHSMLMSTAHKTFSRHYDNTYNVITYNDITYNDNTYNGITYNDISYNEITYNDITCNDITCNDITCNDITCVVGCPNNLKVTSEERLYQTGF